METTKLRRFAQYARRSLMDQVAAKLEQVRATDSAARRESPLALAELEREIANASVDHVVEKVAYTWFNRFVALRFMDVNGYTRIRVVSPADESQFQPEILAEAKMGHMDDERVPEKTRLQVAALLGGNVTSRDPQQEAYRLLVVAECNSFYRAMPYLFERIADYTELLMPDDLLSGNSILAYTREAMTPDTCKDVEVIGWLYQFYISEKKDQVFDGLKKGKKINAEDIPAATQLFTPHWIVRYLVENSLGRLWMLNHPDSKLVEQMDYYIKPEQVETEFLRIEKPEDIKVCDPACGSGHMLTYAFDLLYAIYEEAGADASEIPEKILTHNLFGIELDERAGDLAAFALTMKARAKQRRFFSKGIEPHICVLEKVSFSRDELHEYMSNVGRDLFTLDLRETLSQFEDADNFGSLIRPKLTSVGDVLPLLQAKDMGGQLFLKPIHDKVLKVLRQTGYLSPKYHVVVANPPYMGSKGMNGKLSAWAKDNYPDSKSDLFAMFIERNLDLVVRRGNVGMITMQSWMFLSSYEKLRNSLLNKITLSSMLHLGARAFDSIGGEVVSTTAFVLGNMPHLNMKGSFLRLIDGESEAEKDQMLRDAIENRDCGWFYYAATADFQRIPGNSIAYWASKRVRDVFSELPTLSTVAETREGLTTGSNDLFLRCWHELAISRVGFNINSNEVASKSNKRWFPYVKGGEYRKWAGNYEYVVNWENDGATLKVFSDPETGRIRSHNYNGDYAFRTGFTWSGISSGIFAVRHVPTGFMFDAKGPMGYSIDASRMNELEAFLNSAITNHLLKMLAPTLDFKLGHILNLPLAKGLPNTLSNNAGLAIELAKRDWDSFEISYDFLCFELISQVGSSCSLGTRYSQVRSQWHSMTLELQRIEVENNSILLSAYGLQDELKPEVPLREITLSRNPKYRYANDKSEVELENLLCADTMREFISYATACMFGRYSLDKPGLILANAGDMLADYLRQVPQPRFVPDEDNVIPMLDGDWFTDDITERFRVFLRVTFGDGNYEENLRFIEEALGKDIRKYFVKDFYNDHVKRYKKRPIYWLFASPKGTFSALIYLHRYRPDTVSVVLQYLREFRTKLIARRAYLDQVSISTSATQSEKTKALKEIDILKKQVLELDDYERDTLFPLASAQVPLDLDDGVKVNYLKLGAALKKITGLDAKDDE